ncbi:uncharacterized protein LOC129668356 [Psammomys obesus]|uniref:uncharacterized protein LOC129668356 n=1 Tax=Psammomys obesus TaxID=48139 RepID=UPI002453453D|nr:uncharacterized protein LOC129668356 [Psammomys obesus]
MGSVSLRGPKSPPRPKGRRHFEKSHPGLCSRQGVRDETKCFSFAKLSISSRRFSSSPHLLLLAKLKFQVRLIQLHPSDLRARLVPTAAFHLPGLLWRKLGSCGWVGVNPAATPISYHRLRKYPKASDQGRVECTICRSCGLGAHGQQKQVTGLGNLRECWCVLSAGKEFGDACGQPWRGAEAAWLPSLPALKGQDHTVLSPLSPLMTWHPISICWRKERQINSANQ